MEIVIGFFALLGGVFILIGSIGLVRLPDFYMRLHGPTKATTLGMGSLLFSSVLYFWAEMGHFTIHEILIMLFLFITAPVSAHMLAKAARHTEVKVIKRTKH